jgi:glucan biosynthesis protein C
METGPAPVQRPIRRFDFDWLRTLVVLLLIPFHAGRLFDTHDAFYIQNEALSEGLTFWWMFIGHALGMQFLFLLAGSTTWFALKFRSAKQYLKERALRLILPFIFGVLVIVPVQPYFGMRSSTGAGISYFEFYPSFFTMPETPEGYTGGFTVAHLWFIIFLFIISVIALPVFFLSRSDGGKRLGERLADFFTPGYRIFLLAIPLIGLDRLIDFYWNSLSKMAFFFIFYLTFFIYGYFLMTDERYEESIYRVKRTALIFGPVLFLIVRGIEAKGVIPFLPKLLILHLFYRGTFPWLTILAVLGYGKRYLNSPNKFLLYFGEASYPVYILHQTVIVAIGFYVVGWEAGILAKYVLTTITAYIATFTIYELLIRRFNAIRFLFGMRPKRKLAKGELEGILQSGVSS